MSDAFDELKQWADRFDTALSDSEKNKLTRRIANKLRQNTRKRIRDQRDPSGDKFIPRKRSQSGHIRRAAMFQRLPSMLKTAYSNNHVEVGFVGATSKRAEVHQYGLYAKPSSKQDPVRYDVRRLLGFSDDDVTMITKEIKSFILQD